jgi:uncharacterized protein (TIGR02145 family)
MITYIIKSSLSLLLLFGLYWFLLRREKVFRFNRFFLIFSIIFSLIVPVISIPVQLPENAGQGGIITAVSNTLETYSPEEQITGFVSEKPLTSTSSYVEEKQSPIDLNLVLLVIYLSGVLIFLIRFLRNIIFIKIQIARSEKLTYSGSLLALTGNQVNPYSYFGTIVVNKNDFENDRISSDLLHHELEHVRQSHSLDVMILELIRIIYWFNPILLLYNAAVRINHEYLADNGAINGTYDIRSYAENLIGFICHQNRIRLTCGFNPSLTRKRLLMMTRKKSGKTSEGLRIFVTVNAVIVIFLLISCISSDTQPSRQVKDIDGNVYKTVRIGKQIWMSENLKTTRYNDGEEIALVTDSVEWQNYEPAFCWYKNDEAAYKDKYGAIYNWYAVNTNKLCPAGWHVPDMIEFWYTLPDYLANHGYGVGTTGKEIAKALASTTGWRPDTTAFNIGTKPSDNNKSRFSAIPAGIRTFNGEFGDDGEYATWWSSSDYNEYVGRSFSLINYYSRIQPFWPSKRAGFSVRCVKDVTDPGDFADFTGNWEMNLQKSNNQSNVMAQTLYITQKEDKIIIQERPVMTTMGYDDGKYSYTLNGEEHVDRIDSTTITRESAELSPGKQSFTITNTWISSHNGRTLEIVYNQTYFMVENGKSLVIYSTSSYPRNHYVPPEETEHTTYYDRR